MGSTLSRRRLLGGASLLLPASPAFATPAIVTRKIELVINPWRQQRDHDATVVPGDVNIVEYVWFGVHHKDNWLNVYCKDGRCIQTERYEHQKNIDEIAYQLRAWGFTVMRINVAGGMNKVFHRGNRTGYECERSPL